MQIEVTASFTARPLEMTLEALTEILLGDIGGGRELTAEMEDDGVSWLGDFLLPVVEPIHIDRQPPSLARHRSSRGAPERNAPARPSGTALRAAGPRPELPVI